MKRMPTRAFAAALAIALAGVAADAHALLTTSEQAQVDSFVAEGKLVSVPRVRALVARPDLSNDESAAALGSSVARVPFNDVRAAYLRDLLFGGASQASRPVLAIAVTRAAIARADALYRMREGKTDAEPAWAAELARVYAFLDEDVAYALQTAAAPRETTSGIPTSSYDECAKAIAAHIAAHPEWLKADKAIPQGAVALRAQAQIALVDMMNDSATKRVDAADKIGLGGPRRVLFRETGLLLAEASPAPNAAVERVRAVSARFPGARAGLAAITFGDVKPQLHARGLVLAVKTPLDATAGDGPSLFSDEVEGASIDASLGEVAYALASVAVRRALDARPQLRAQADRDVRGSKGARLFGSAADANAETVLAKGAQLLAVDAKRTIDLAMVRWIGNNPESLAILSDTLGALASYAPTTSTPNGVAIPLGVPVGKGESSETVAATNVHLAAAGYVTGFTFEGHAWTIARDDTGAVAAKRDGAPVVFGMLANARLPVTDGTMWSAPGATFAKMQGAPRAGVAAGGHVRVVGTSEKGFDAIATSAPSDDVLIECDASLRGDVAFAVRAAAGRDTWRGVALVVTPAASAASASRASLRAFDDRGHESELAAPVDLPATPSLHVKIVLKGDKLEATIGGVSLKAVVPAALARGDVVLAAKRGGAIDATAWTVRHP